MGVVILVAIQKQKNLFLGMIYVKDNVISIILVKGINTFIKKKKIKIMEGILIPMARHILFLQ